MWLKEALSVQIYLRGIAYVPKKFLRNLQSTLMSLLMPLCPLTARENLTAAMSSLPSLRKSRQSRLCSQCFLVERLK